MEEAAFVAGAIAIKAYSEDTLLSKRIGPRAKRTSGNLRVRNEFCIATCTLPL